MKASLISAFLMVFICHVVHSQCPAISCNDKIQISIGSECFVALDADLLIESPGDADYTVKVFDQFENLIGDTLTATYTNQQLKYKVIDECGNSCTGEIILEFNAVLPGIEAQCEFIPGVSVTGAGKLDAFNKVDSVMIMPTESCHTSLDIDIETKFFFNEGSYAHGEPSFDQSTSTAELLDPLGNVVTTILIDDTGLFSGSFVINPNLKYTLTITADDSRAFGSYEISLDIDDCGIDPDCVSWCGSTPKNFITVDSVLTLINTGCSAPIVGDIMVDIHTSGDICSPDGELSVVNYTATTIMHGEKVNTLLLRQAYRTEKLDISPSLTGSGTVTPIFFPNNLNLGCNADASPEAIFAETGSGTLAYPYYIDEYTEIPDTVFKEVIVHYHVVKDTTEEMTLIRTDVDGDGTPEEIWSLVEVINKELKDSIRIDTVIEGFRNPIVLIQEKRCNLVAAFSDDEFQACMGGKKIVRNWTIIDWCDGRTTLSATQNIELFDDEAPVVLQPDDIVISIDPWTCAGRAPLPILDITDNCATEFDITYKSPYGIIENGFISGIPAQDSLIPVELTVTDGCSNMTSVILNVQVVDLISPVAVCQDNIVVSLTRGDKVSFDGVAKVMADVFDANSHDSGCGEITFKVIRMEDTEEFVTDCDGKELGFKPVTCFPTTEEVDLLCVKDSSQYSAVAVPGDYVKFCCEDVGKELFVIVIVTDKFGNENRCMVSVNVTNKGGGNLVCEPITVGCAADLEGAEKPQIIGDICADDLEVVLLAETDNELGCGSGTIIREWYIDLDASGDLSGGDGYCEQLVTIDAAVEGFDPYTIKWPKHYDGNYFDGFNLECTAGEGVEREQTVVLMGEAFTCMSGLLDQIPVWCEPTCGLVGYSVESDTVIASDACLKIINRWTVVDWCLWDSNADNQDDENDQISDSFVAIEDWTQGICTSCPEYGPEILDSVYFQYDKVDVDGYYTYDQVIKVVDDSAPIVVLESDTVVVNTTGGSDQKQGDRLCFGSEVITASAMDFCDGIESPAEFLQWTIEVEDENGDPVLGDDGTNIKLSRGSTASISTREGSPGDVRYIKWRVADGCGNQGFGRTTVLYGDEKKPTPVCIVGLTTVFMASDNTAAIWAKDYDLGSFDNCTAKEDLRFSVVPLGGTPVHPDDEGFVDQASIFFTCEGLTESLQVLDVYVWDASGNGDYCTVSLLFSNDCDNDDPEPGNGAMISGVIETELGDRIPSTTVSVNSVLEEYPLATITGDEGMYAFANNPIDVDYQLSASKDDSHVNGVTTIDIVLIQKHILSVAKFDTPYKLIAADANADQKITALDLIELRKLILGINTEFTNNQSWLFADAQQTFFDDLSPWPFVSRLGLNNLERDQMDEDFIGIKVGDVNNSVIVNSLKRADIRSEDQVSLGVEVKQLVKGQTEFIKVYAQDFDEVYGFQFTLSHPGIKVKNIMGGDIAIASEHYRIVDGRTMFSWSAVESVSSDGVLFVMEVEAMSDLTIESNLAIDQSLQFDIAGITAAEAYVGDDLRRVNIDMMVINGLGPIEVSTTLYQNEPNPFKRQTTISFYLAEAGEATLSILGSDGKLIETLVADYSAGDQEYLLDWTGHESGVYYYQLESGAETITKKMIVLE